MNVVVICCDTFRADIIGPGKSLSRIRTPNLDDLAAESVVFTRCFGEGEPTIPVRRCVFSGRRSFPWNQGTPNEGLQPSGHGWHAIGPDHDTLAERLFDAGHTTGLVSDVYHMFKPTMDLTRGFLSWRFLRGQENDGYRSGPLSRIDLAAHTPSDKPNPADHAVIVQYLLNMLDRQPGEEHYLAATVFREASQWLQDNAANRPFFLWVDSFSPHELWDPPRHYADAYYHDPAVKDYIHHSVLHGHDASPAEVERTKALYAGYVTFVDRWIGHLLESIDALGLRDDTAVLFFSDHGTQLMDRGRFGKGADALFPFNTQQNWTIRHPEGPRGQTCDAWVQNQDLPATILRLCGVENEPLDGVDAWALATGDVAPSRDHIVTGWGNRANVRDARYSAHTTVTEADAAWEVYDLQADPEERTPLAEVPAEAVASARARLEAVVGELPARFNEYRQRHAARNMRTRYVR